MIYENEQTFTIKEGCPWYGMQQTFGPPNVNWCEPTSCSIINEPANAWSNFGMIIPGLIIWFSYAKKFQNLWVRFYGPVVFFMGLFSFIYHSTNNLATQYLDFIGMYLYTGTILTLNWERLTQKLQGWKTYLVFFAINNAVFFLCVYLNWSYQKIVIYNILAMLILEAAIFFKKKESKTQYKFFYISLFFWAVAQTFSLLDHTRTWCEPENVFLHGHALWHMFAGVGSVFGFIYYKQFNKN